MVTSMDPSAQITVQGTEGRKRTLGGRVTTDETLLGRAQGTHQPTVQLQTHKRTQQTRI